MTPSAEFRRLMTPEMVEDLEVWMLEFFGATEAVQYVSETERKIFIGHRAWEQLKHLALPDVPRAPSILDGWRL